MSVRFGKRAFEWAVAVTVAAGLAAAPFAEAGAVPPTVAATVAADHAMIRETLTVAEGLAAEMRRLDTVDAERVTAVADVLSGLVEGCHVPWEERVVMAAVSGGGSAAQRVTVARLEKEHAEVAVLIRDLRWQLARAEAGEAVAAALVADDLDAISQLLRDHMRSEEDQIVPALAAVGSEPAGDGETASESRCRGRYRGMLDGLENRPVDKEGR